MTAHEKNQLDEVNKKIDRILFYLLDDKETGSKGIVSTVKENSKKLEEFETNEKVKRGKWSVYTILGSGVLTGLIWVVEKFVI